MLLFYNMENMENMEKFIIYMLNGTIEAVFCLLILALSLLLNFLDKLSAINKKHKKSLAENTDYAIGKKDGFAGGSRQSQSSEAYMDGYSDGSKIARNQHTDVPTDNNTVAIDLDNYLSSLSTKSATINTKDKQ